MFSPSNTLFFPHETKIRLFVLREKSAVVLQILPKYLVGNYRADYLFLYLSGQDIFFYKIWRQILKTP